MLATLKRVFYVGVGLLLLASGLLGRIPNYSELIPWRRALVCLGGVFLVYRGALYYFPTHRKKRAELDRFLDQLERELVAEDRK